MELWRRPRRLRQSAAMRRLARETQVHPSQLILPVFVREGISQPQPLQSMPGVMHHSLDSLATVSEQVVAAGLGGIMLFGVPAQRDAVGSGGCDPQGILNRGLQRVRATVGDDTVIMSDLCLDEFTDHGHCGVLSATGVVDNDATLEIYGRMAVAQAQAGAHMVGPSGMMDGQVAVIRAALDAAGFTDTGILAYGAKYASAAYGPFREAVVSALDGDRKTYQQDPANRREGVLEACLDAEQGADMVMVKPAGLYLDVLSEVAQAVDIPVSAYQVSGEMAMIEAASQRGWVEREPLIAESLVSIVRAGANNVLTYYALEAAALIKSGRFF